MSSLAIGCDVAAASNTAISFEASEISVFATVTPAMSPLFEGQAVADIAGYAAMTATSNFVPSSGAVVFASVDATGDAATPEMPVLEAQSAGFVVTVVDSNGGTHVFDAGSTTIEYKVRVNQVANSEAEIDINPLVPDAEPLEITISGGTSYDGMHVTTAGALRNGPIDLVSPVLSGANMVGDTLTADDGLWATPTGMLTLHRQWQRDGVDIPGQTGITYVVSAGDEGSQLTFAVTGQDGLNIPHTIASNGLDIPNTQSVTVSPVGSYVEHPAGNTVPDQTLDLGPAAPGKELFVVCAWAETVPSAPAMGLSVTLNGVTADLAGQVKAASSDNLVSIYRANASSGGMQTLSIVNAGSNALRGVSSEVFLASGHSTATFVDSTNGSYAPIDLSAAITEGAQIVGAARLGSAQTGADLALTGLTESNKSAVGFHNGLNVHFNASSTQTETRTMIATPTGDGAGAVVGALIVVA